MQPEENQYVGGDDQMNNPYKQGSFSSHFNAIIISLAVIIFIAVLAGVFYFFVWPNIKGGQTKTTTEKAPANSQESSSTSISLPSVDLIGQDSNSSLSDFQQLPIEYLSFASFYQEPTAFSDSFTPVFDLPINSKIEVLNYYDVSRKLPLDNYLDLINNQGFAVLDNPWSKEAFDPYAVYSKLNGKRVPLLLTSDFLSYSYQNRLKNLYKDIEKNIFYDNLWEVGQRLFEVSRARYESRLAAIGDINDRVLEAERLETAFFATLIDLLAPDSGQVAAQGKVADSRLFTEAEAKKYSFNIPTYLQDDLASELKLIREAKSEKTRSPIRLYQADYRNFSVPSEYRNNYKLYNFYLASKWLNSVFPLNYRDDNCQECLLDKEDWQINFTAANIISQDLASLPELKSKWARIYKTIAFFQGLRDDLNYVHYRDAAANLFGQDYQAINIFDEAEGQSANNLEKLRQELAKKNFSNLAGAYDKESDYQLIGLKVLAESYWPNKYIVDRLNAAGEYHGNASTNLTACQNRAAVTTRCNGFSLDFINLVFPLGGNSYFLDNSSYDDYDLKAEELRQEIGTADLWHANNYWNNLKTVADHLSTSGSQLPPYAANEAWRSRLIGFAAASWVSLQLPLDKPTVATSSQSASSLDNSSKNVEDAYLEPDYSLIAELEASSQMIIRMLEALGLDYGAGISFKSLQTYRNDLEKLRLLAIKEISGQVLSEDDKLTIFDFIQKQSVEPSNASSKQIGLNLGDPKKTVKEDLSVLKLLLITRQEGNNKIFSVGPVWSLKESR